MVNLINKTFNGNKITCDNGNSFSVSKNLVCNGAKYYQESPLDQLTTLKDGTKRYVISVIGMKNGEVELKEHTYKYGKSYASGAKPLSVNGSNFKVLSDRAMLFYTKDIQSDFLGNIWYIDNNNSVKGYKLYVDKAVSCEAKALK